jgi:hypothetical protein
MTTVTFAGGFPNSGPGSSGPIGIAFGPTTPLGPPGPMGSTVMVTDPVGTGTAGMGVYVFPDHLDGKAAGAVTPVAYPVSASVGLAMVDIGAGYNYYMTSQSSGTLLQISGTGALVGPVFPAGTIPGATGICPYPPDLPPSAFSGHVFISSATDPTGTIWNVNPLSLPPTVVPFATGVPHPDGLCISPDGSILYVALWSIGAIGAYSIATGAPLFTTPFIHAALDGLALGQGSLLGYIYANCNDGTIVEYGLPGGPTPGSITDIGTRVGARGDFIAVDPASSGAGPPTSLLVTGTSSVERINAPPGPAPGDLASTAVAQGWFFGPPVSSTKISFNAAPGASPWTLGIMQLAMLALGLSVMLRRLDPRRA